MRVHKYAFSENRLEPLSIKLLVRLRCKKCKENLQLQIARARAKSRFKLYG